MQYTCIDTSTAAYEPQHWKNSSCTQLHQRASKMHLLHLGYTTESYLILILCFMYITPSVITVRYSDVVLVERQTYTSL